MVRDILVTFGLLYEKAPLAVLTCGLGTGYGFYGVGSGLKDGGLMLRVEGLGSVFMFDSSRFGAHGANEKKACGEVGLGFRV